MLRSWTIAAAALLLLLPLAGCWSRNELNDLAIVVGLGIDKEGDQYEVSVQIVNPSQVSLRNGMNRSIAPVTTFTERGKTVPEALRRMTTVLSKNLYFSHLRIVIFGEKLAREGIGQPLDFISRDPEMRNDFYLVVARGTKSSDVLKIYSPIEPIPANNLNSKLANADRLWAAAGKITLDQLMIDLMTEGKDPALTGIRILGDEAEGQNERAGEMLTPKTVLAYTGMAVFRKDRMVGWLDEEGTKTLNYLEGQVKETLITVPCSGGGDVSLAVNRETTRIRIGRSADQPVVNAYIRLEADVADVECKLDMSKNETLERIGKQAEQKVKDVLTEEVEKVQTEYRADIYGFGRHIHRQQPELWRRVGNWDEEFARLRVRIHPTVYIRRIGTTDQSAIGELE